MAIVQVLASRADRDAHQSACLDGHHQARSATPITTLAAASCGSSSNFQTHCVSALSGRWREELIMNEQQKNFRIY
jgi:hypothetical protein